MSERQARIEELVRFLCSRECAGRAPGTPGSAAARARIVAELERAGVAPFGEDGYLQEVPGCGWNVLGRLPGQGPLAARAVLVAAHYDHLGAAPGGQAYWGADDNAAAVAILLDVAAALARAPGALGRQVVIAAFDGEEPPHFLSGTMGSMRYVARPRLPLADTDAMVCMDLVGHAVGPAGAPSAVREALFVLGAELSAGTPALVDAVAARARGVRPRRLALDVVPPLSDYHAFEQAGVPVLFLTCGRWEHYHQVTDTPDRLDYPKIVATADFLRELVVELSARPEPRVAFLPGGRDDAATIRTLGEMGELLAPLLPPAQVGPLRAHLAGLARAAASRALSPAERGSLGALVGMLEQLLS